LNTASAPTILVDEDGRIDDVATDGAFTNSWAASRAPDGLWPFPGTRQLANVHHDRPTSAARGRHLRMARRLAG